MRPIQIMLVEDEALVAMRQMMDLVAEGFELCGWVSSGEEAVKLAQEKNPDVALMDIRLSGTIDGIEALRQIRTFSKMPVVFVTGYNDVRLIERAMELQPSTCLIKPVEIREVLEAIHAMIKKTTNNWVL